MHHIDGDGKDGGVVYCEMQGCENTEEELRDRGVVTALFGPGHGYAANTGGKIAAIRSLTNADVRAYHTAMYRPSNLIVTVAGDVEVAAVLQCLEPIEAKRVDERWRHQLRPWQTPVATLSTQPIATVVPTVIQFPDEEDGGSDDGSDDDGSGGGSDDGGSEVDSEVDSEGPSPDEDEQEGYGVETGDKAGASNGSDDGSATCTDEDDSSAAGSTSDASDGASGGHGPGGKRGTTGSTSAGRRAPASKRLRTDARGSSWCFPEAVNNVCTKLLSCRSQGDESSDDDREPLMGSAVFAWLGPLWSDFKARSHLLVLLTYLMESAVAPLQRAFVEGGGCRVQLARV